MKRVAIRFGSFVLFVHSDDPDMDGLLVEAEHRGRPLGGAYSAIRHQAHTPQGQSHLHVYKRQNELFALNLDSTAHDQSHGVRIPNRVADAIRQQYPDWRLPKNKVIEAIDTEGRIRLFLEGCEAEDITDPLGFGDWRLLVEG